MCGFVKSGSAGSGTNNAGVESLSHALEDMCGATPEDNSASSFHRILYAEARVEQGTLSQSRMAACHKGTNAVGQLPIANGLTAAEDGNTIPTTDQIKLAP